MKNKLNVIVAGGRDFNNYQLLSDKLDHLLSSVDKKDVILIVGGAKGADTLGKQYAEDNGINYQVMNADWDTHGKKAGVLRNIEMAKVANALVAFWDGESSGTKHMIEEARRKDLKVRVIYYKMLAQDVTILGD